MNTIFGNRPIRLSALGDFSQLTVATKDHLKNVYTCLMISMLSAGAGAFLSLKMAFGQGGLLTAIAGFIGLMLWLASTAHNKENQTKRLGILAAFAGTCGISLGSLINMTIQIDPQIVVTAFMTTSVIFACFAVCASSLDPGSVLIHVSRMSELSMLSPCLLSRIWISIGSSLQFHAELYPRMAVVFCFILYILYDTQLIVEKFSNGDQDYIWHSVDFFLDFIKLLYLIISHPIVIKIIKFFDHIMSLLAYIGKIKKRFRRNN